MEPVGSAMMLPQDLQVTAVVTCEYRIFSALHSLHCTFWNLLFGFGTKMWARFVMPLAPIFVV